MVESACFEVGRVTNFAVFFLHLQTKRSQAFIATLLFDPSMSALPIIAKLNRLA